MVATTASDRKPRKGDGEAPLPDRGVDDGDARSSAPVERPPKTEKDQGYNESHGYPPGHGGPTGPGDAPAVNERRDAPDRHPDSRR